MPSKSPTQAFEPSPAMADGDHINKENARILSPARLNSTTSEPIFPNNRRPSREVRFSPVSSPTGRTHSMSFNPPLLEQIPSASEMPRSNRLPSASGSTDLTAYTEQCRSVLETQRLSIERERESWAEERKLWDTERFMMQSRIAELEFTINRSGVRNSSSDSAFINAPSSNSDHAIPGASNGHDSRRTSSSGSHQFWEGAAAGTVATRVFSNEEIKKAEERLPSIAEDESPSKELATKNVAERKASVGVPIEKVDSKLDGITLKASAFPPAFVARVMTPESPSPTRSPGLRSNAPTMNLQILREVNLDEENLTKHAGHTPMGPRLAVQGIVNTQSNVDTPTQERPQAPPQSVHPPAERLDSYFPASDEDPQLKGPLTLEKDGNDNKFLNELDEKLIQEARKVIYEPSETSESEEQDDEDAGPKLRLRPSMNFGSKFGSSSCGNL